MKVQLVRHATLIISVKNKRILVDPMLSIAGSMEPIEKVPNQNYNPLVEIPTGIDDITNCDAVLITHTHRDHFDEAAAKLLPKNLPMFCQPEDEIKLLSQGFTNVQPIYDTYTWKSITFNRTSGKHGNGLIAIRMAPVSGFVISSSEEPSIYIAGDTIWCRKVEKSIEKYKPEILICNCGAAQFHFGGPITMTAEDVYGLGYKYRNMQIVAVHMEAWNHCRLSREDLKDYINSKNTNINLLIPEDGEILSF